MNDLSMNFQNDSDSDKMLSYWTSVNVNYCPWKNTASVWKKYKTDSEILKPECVLDYYQNIKRVSILDIL